MYEYTVILANGIALKVRADSLQVEHGYYLLLTGEDIAAVIPNTAYICRMDSQESVTQVEPSYK